MAAANEKILNTQEDARLDILNWIAENLRIIDKNGVLTKLNPNVGQLKLHNTINLQRSRGLPVRIILLKPRQVGWSTWSEAEGFSEVHNRPNRSAMAVSADADATNSIFQMTQLFEAELPPSIKRPKDKSNRKELIYSAPHRSRFIAQTAGKDVLGRGSTVHFLHCSEVAFWTNAKEQLAALFQMVPSKPDTTIILESTANGVGGAFYDMFWQAVERIKENPGDYSGFIPVFFPWHEFPEYQTALPQGYVLEPDEDEIELIRRYNLSDEQLYWRRLKIQELGGDVALFKQEYPATAREAFQTTGRNVFAQSVIDKLAGRITKPRTGLFYREGDEIGIKDVERQIECWQIWRKPNPSHQYALGIDTMEGRVSDQADPRSDPDYHGAVIFDRVTFEVVALYKGRCEQHDLGEQCLLAAEYYNNAWTAIEIPNGKTVLDIFKLAGYPNLFRRQIHDLQDVEDDTDDYGWRTTLMTRPWLVDGLIGIMRDNDLVIYSGDIIAEMRTFIRDKTGKPIHLPGEHDDLLFGLMIAIQVHTRCPLEALSYPSSHTGRIEKQHRQSLAMVGVIDDESDMFGDEEEGAYTV